MIEPRPELFAGLFHLIAGKLVVFLPNPNRVFLSHCSLSASRAARRQSVSRSRALNAFYLADGSPSAFLADWSNVE